MSLAAAQLRGTPWLLSQQRRPQPSLRRAVTTAALESVDFHALGVTAVDALAGTPLKLAGTLGISAASWQALVWGNREYILAAHVQNNTPPGAVVVEYGTKQGLSLNFYPPSVKSVFCVDTELGDAGMLASVAARANVCLSGTQKVSAYAERLSMPAGSADCVTSIRALGGAGVDARAAVLEVARLLRPGGRFVFFEQGGAPSELTETLRKCGMFNSVVYDRAWSQYPLGMATCIGLAQRSSAVLSVPGGVTQSAGAGAKPARVREPTSTARGFGAAAEAPPAPSSTPPPAAEAASVAAAGFGGGPKPPAAKGKPPAKRKK